VTVYFQLPAGRPGVPGLVSALKRGRDRDPMDEENFPSVANRDMVKRPEGPRPGDERPGQGRCAALWPVRVELRGGPAWDLLRMLRSLRSAWPQGSGPLDEFGPTTDPLS
jgi:hypothetical protein